MSAQSLINITQSPEHTKMLKALLLCANNGTMTRKQLREEYEKLDLKSNEFRLIKKYTNPKNTELLYNELAFLETIGELL